MHWRTVAGFPNYQVSRAGQVRSLKRNKLLALVEDKRGYIHVTLYRDARPTNFLVHRLVAAAFIGTIPPGQEVNHKDGDKSNNTLENLEILTPQENKRHAARTGLLRSGESNPKARLKEADVREIRRRYAEGTRVRELAHQYDISEHSLYALIRRATWKHVA